MDSDAKLQTSVLLQRLKSEGISIMISSHESHTVEHIADHHLQLENGQIETLELPSSSAKESVLKTAKNKV